MMRDGVHPSTSLPLRSGRTAFKRFVLSPSKHEALTPCVPSRSKHERPRAALILLLALTAAPIFAAETYPAPRPIRLVSPFAAGGSTDIVGRLLAPRLAERLGQNVVVENRPGAGGMIGTSHVAKATPDGHTLLFISGAFVAHSAVTKNLPYDPNRDFAWITMVLSYPFIVVVKADSPIQTVNDLIA